MNTLDTLNLKKLFELFPALSYDLETLPKNHEFLPNTDILETEKEYEVNIGIPGLNKSDFNIKVEDNVLIVSGERKKSDKKYNMNETRYGKFIRKFDLPKEVNIEDIGASYVDGILSIKIPKDTTKLKTKSIEVK